MRPARQPGSSPALRHASAVTSSHELPVSDVTGEHLGNAPDDVITDSDGDRQPLELERDIVRRRIDLFEKQVSNDCIVQSCPWVGFTRGLGWEWVENLFLVGWVMGLKWQMCEKYMSDYILTQ